jgi:hypothetical protein
MADPDRIHRRKTFLPRIPSSGIDPHQAGACQRRWFFGKQITAGTAL